MNEKYRLKNGKEIEIKPLTLVHLDEIIQLQNEVISALETSSALQPLSKAEFTSILSGKGLLIGAYDEQKLIAFRALLEPEIDEDHLGKDAGLAEQDWSSVIYSEITNVHPDFRGNGLQVLLGKVLLKAIDQERYRYVAATVAPFNIPSLRDKFAHGLQIVGLKEKYEGMLRYILIKDFSRPEKIDAYIEEKQISMIHTKEQQDLLQNGWLGVGIEKKNEEWHVLFKREN